MSAYTRAKKAVKPAGHPGFERALEAALEEADRRGPRDNTAEVLASVPWTKEGRAARAKAVIPGNQYRSMLESDRAEYLEGLRIAGEIIAWRYEPIRIALGGGAYYKPDMMIISRECDVILEEIKGRWRTPDRIRIKVAASRLPWFIFRAVTRDKGAWEIEEFGP